MILGPALADVMQQQRDIENLAVDPGLEDARNQRQFLNQLAPLDLGQIADALDGVFVHGIAVIHVELHHRHDGFEFGDERGQHSQLVHPPQRPLGIAVFQQQIHEDLLRLSQGAQFVVDQMQIGRDQAHGIRVDQHPGAQRLLEQAQQVQLVPEEVRLVLDGQPVVDHLIPGLDLGCAAENPFQQGAGLDVKRLQLGQEDPGQITYRCGMAEIILHEMLDRAATALVDIAHPLGHLHLQVEG